MTIELFGLDYMAAPYRWRRVRRSRAFTGYEHMVWAKGPKDSTYEGFRFMGHPAVKKNKRVYR